jgi:hypothetical protein
LLSPDEPREGLALLPTLVEPTPTGNLSLYEVAPEIGMTVNHSTYHTIQLAFAIAMGASGVVVADRPFLRDMQTHPDRALAAMVVLLDAWARSAGIA